MTSSILETTAPELVAGVVSGLLVLYGWEGAAFFRRWVDRVLIGRLRSLSSMAWDWRLVAVVLGTVFVVASFVQSGPVSCSTGEDDTLVLLQSGQRFLSGANPFGTFQCGHSVLAPYGIASVLLDALGSFGGRVGIWLVWNLAALLLIPLTWALGGVHRWYATVFVASSVFFAPLVIGSIQGGHSAIVPVTALLCVWLALRQTSFSGVLAGFLSTVKFPSLFPYWGGLSGAGRERLRGLLLSAVVFGGLSLAVTWIWGGYAYTLLFTQQLSRADLSINEFGVLIPLRAMPSPEILEVAQGLSLLAALLWVHLRKWAAVPAIAFMSVVVGLVAQRFTLNFTVWLLPVALLGPVYSRWLFALGIIGVVNEALALPTCMAQGSCTASEGLGGLFGIVLVLLLVQMLRDEATFRAQPARNAPVSGGTTASPQPVPAPIPSTSFQSAPRVEGRGALDGLAWPNAETTVPLDG